MIKTSTLQLTYKSNIVFTVVLNRNHEEIHISWPSSVLVLYHHVFISIYNLYITIAVATLAIFLLERSLLVTNFILNKARLFVICTLKNRAITLLAGESPEL